MAQPVQQSPFSVTSNSGTGSPLTVADVLPELPPDIARAGALPMDQPVAVSPQALEEALRGGQAALPIFEIYRVCPALFQTPVSPQDPRMIPLPASKLPRLIAATQPGKASPQSMPLGASPGGSPFAFGMPAPSGLTPSSVESPAIAQPSLSGMMLPPKRQGPPPPLADIPGRDSAVPQLSLPGQPPAFGAAPVFPTSLFAASTGPKESPPASAATPLPASPFGTTPGAVSPFSAAAAPASPPPQSGALSSPFAAISPSGGNPEPQESPFGALFGNKAVPTGQPAPDSFAAKPAAAPMPGFPTSAPATSSFQVRISLASLLKGYSAAELGFDPMIVPGWITTSLPTQNVHELASAGAPIIGLGMLVDGITDVGFRNVLNTAKRDFQLRLPREELQNALSNGAPPSLPNLASLGVAPSLAPAPAPALGGVMRFEPPSTPPGGLASPFAPVAPVESSSVPGTNSPFLAPSAAPTPAPMPAPAPAPVFAPAAFQPEAPMPSLFTPAASQFAPAQPFPMANPGTSIFSAPAAENAPQSQPLPASPPISFQAAAVPPALASFQPLAVPAPGFAIPTKTQDPFSAFKPAPFEPVPAAFSAPAAAPVPEVPAYQAPIENPPPVVSAPEPVPTPPAAEMTVLPPERPQDFTPPPNPYAFMAAKVEEGFSSDQLLGREVSPPSQPVRPAPAAEDDLQRGGFQVPTPKQSPSSFFDVEEEAPDQTSPPRAFVPPALDDEWDKAAAAPASRPQPQSKPVEMSPLRPASSPRPASGPPSLGVQTHNTNPDQILLRALLGTDSELTPQKVVEMSCALPGIAACVCIHGQNSFSHVGAHKPQARDFQRQATDLAQHLKTLAPLIGIEGAETFTMNSGDRLMTFCFPDGAILGVLHDAEPTLGLRDKITLIARELSRMIA